MIHLTAPLMPSRLFQTGSIALPASRELHFVAICEHLHQNLFWACISRIHAQVPVIMTGKLTETFHQQIACGIDVSVMGCLAFNLKRGSLIYLNCDSADRLAARPFRRPSHLDQLRDN